MKKEVFYRTLQGNGPGARKFLADNGYIYNLVIPGSPSIGFAIARTASGEWDITHISSGCRACVKTYKNKKEALQQFDDESYIYAVIRLSNINQTKKLEKELNEYKQKKGDQNNVNNQRNRKQRN